METRGRRQAAVPGEAKTRTHQIVPPTPRMRVLRAPALLLLLSGALVLTPSGADKKKGGKFQPFKKLFGKRKKKDTSISREAEAGRKSHSPQSVSNGTFSSDEETLEDSLRSFNYSMGARAFSHDSIFIPDGGAESEQTVQAMSQDNILGKVKTLQRQLGKNIKFGQPPPSATPMKRADSGEASLEGDPLLASPMEPVTQQDLILPDAENKSSDTPSSPSPPNPPGARSEMEEKAAPAKPSRPKRHFSSAGTIESVNLDAIPLAIARLDNSAAKHKLSVKPKNQRVSKKHRRLGLAGARPNEQGGLPSQLSLDQNGHPGEDKLTWHEEEPEPLDAEEEKRCQEEYWRELEAKCKRQKAEAAERRRLEEQRLRALEQRLWEENRRQELLEEEGEEQEGEEGEPQPEAGRRLDEQGSPAPGCGEPAEGGPPEAGEQEPPEEEAEQELEARSRQEAEKRRQEAEERELKELRRLEELEEQRRREAEKQRLAEEERKKREEEERRLREEEERKKREEEEERRLREEEERKRREEEEQRLREAERKRREEEEQRQREAERKRREEEEQRQREAERKRREEEEQRLREEEEQRQREEEENRTKELRRREEEEARRREELRRRQEEVEAQRRREAEKEPQGARGGEESGLGADDRSPPQTGSAGEPEHLKPEKRRENAGAPSACGKQGPEAEPAGEPQAQRADARGRDGCAGPEERGEARTPPAQKPGACGGEAPARDRDRRVEELRWQEVEERQTMPRPYTFQVSSGGKQILFPKVNLSPVTPTRDAGLASAPQQPKAPRASPAPHALPSSLSIPHTAILVTGAQLCGPAVNLSQIKDTACKSLLGLAEEKKHGDAPTLDHPPRAPPGADPRAGGGGKARPPQESASSAAALAEWASIRSRILKSAEGDPRGKRDQPPPGDEPAPRARCDSRGTLRKTPPGNAKFSIMPAWQKFSDGGAETSKQSAGAESTRKRPGLGASDQTAPPPLAAESEEPQKGPEHVAARQEPADTTEGCKFAKDLPSFLVPSPPYPPQKAGAQAEPVTASGSETAGGAGKPDPVLPGGEEKASSPFGIKLRRTNYSLRFHCDQQAEQKKKKRNGSPGDRAEGAPPAPACTDGEKAAEGAPALKQGPSLPAESKQGPSSWKDSAGSPSSPPPPAQPGPSPVSSQTPAPEHTKAANRMPMAQKPALAPKPSGQTPPTSPLCKLSRPYLVELLARRPGKPDPEPSELCKEGQERREPGPPSPPPPRREEKEEVEAERKAGAPALSAAPQEKPSQTPEAGRKVQPHSICRGDNLSSILQMTTPTSEKSDDLSAPYSGKASLGKSSLPEKPVLQSRHSLDGSKLVEKVETAQPLWITLALQKQKGFREQQATREERKQAREAKQAEKLSKDVSVSPQPGSSSVSRAGSLLKSMAHPEDKKPETAGSRLERREQLKKANTLPTSVTVEISDSPPPAPLVKEVTKRFSTPDAAPVSTEPAWLALAKRKAKAWSDCPQIINNGERTTRREK